MDILTRRPPRPDYRIEYGASAHQFGHLWIPEGHGISEGHGNPAGGKRALVPLVVFFHGGWWKSAYDLGYTGHLCAALKKEGIACWSVEYRRVGETGGGWPNTFLDAAAGFDFVATLAQSYPIDLARVMTMGHSAGGHLAFWVAGRHHLDPHGELHVQEPKVPLVGSIALAGAVDLRLTIDLCGDGVFAHDRSEVFALMGGSPEERPERYKEGNPGDLLPFHLPQILIQGTADDQIPPGLPARWADRSRRTGDSVSLSLLPSVDHFDVVDPESRAWPAVRDAARRMLAL